jgi:hypothetical protein
MGSRFASVGPSSFDEKLSRATARDTGEQTMSDDSAGFTPIEPTPVVPTPPAPAAPAAPPAVAPPAYSGQPTQPTQPAYPAQPGYPGQPGQPAYGAHPGQPTPPPYGSSPGQQPYGAQPGYPAQPGQPGYGGYPGQQGPPTGYAPQPYSANGYASPAYPAYYGAPVPPRGLSITSMILGIVGVLGITAYGLGIFPAIAAVITGHIAQKKQPYAKGFWLTGIITGYVSIVLSLLVGGLIAFFIILAVNNPEYGSSSYSDY